MPTTGVPKASDSNTLIGVPSHRDDIKNTLECNSIPNGFSIYPNNLILVSKDFR